MPKQKSHDEFVDELKIKRPDIKVLGKYVNSTTKIKISHNCGYVWDALPPTIINSKSCPDCGNVRELEIKSVISQGFSRTVCSDGLSYPNKFARAFLSQLPVSNLIHEYSPFWAGRYSYDNYFVYNNKQYLLEMDGEFHYKSQQLGNHTLENQIEIDKIKDKLAVENGIYMIRIDCKIPNFEYIKYNILNSEIANLFDLNSVDWTKCEKHAVKNLTKEVCDYYQNNKKDLTLDELGKIFSISSFTASKYIKSGKTIGWIKDDIDSSLLMSYQIKNPKSKKLFVYDLNGNKILEFKSMNLCAKQMSISTRCTFSSSSIRYAIKYKDGKYKGYIFQYN